MLRWVLVWVLQSSLFGWVDEHTQYQISKPLSRVINLFVFNLVPALAFYENYSTATERLRLVELRMIVSTIHTTSTEARFCSTSQYFHNISLLYDCLLCLAILECGEDTELVQGGQWLVRRSAKILLQMYRGRQERNWMKLPSSSFRKLFVFQEAFSELAIVDFCSSHFRSFFGARSTSSHRQTWSFVHGVSQVFSP